MQSIISQKLQHGDVISWPRKGIKRVICYLGEVHASYKNHNWEKKAALNRVIPYAKAYFFRGISMDRSLTAKEAQG